MIQLKREESAAKSKVSCSAFYFVSAESINTALTESLSSRWSACD